MLPFSLDFAGVGYKFHFSEQDLLYRTEQGIAYKTVVDMLYSI